MTNESILPRLRLVLLGFVAIVAHSGTLRTGSNTRYAPSTRSRPAG
jgi:hypothetical protein